MSEDTKLDIWCHLTEAQVIAGRLGIDWLALEILKLKKKWERRECDARREGPQGAQ